MIQKRFTAYSVLLLFFISNLGALELKQDSLAIKFSGYLGFENGQVVHGRYRDKYVDHCWIGNTIGNFTLNVRLGDHLALVSTLEGRWWLTNFPPEAISNKKMGLENYADFYLSQAQGIFSLLNREKISLDLSFGIIPFKYNPEARNLGEYLFRSMCYPGIIWNHFDFAQDRLTGIRMNLMYQTAIGRFSTDAFFLTERKIRPFNDMSIAAILDYKVPFINLGIGTELYRVIPVKDKYTTPHDLTNQYVSGSDTAYYTFSGTKLMAHLTIDPLFFLRDKRAGKILGEGGKMYGEMDMLGIKNYPENGTTGGNNYYGYDTPKDKTIWMCGFNIPVPFLFDVCAFELEYYGMKYPNSYINVFEDGLPLPGNPWLDTLNTPDLPANAYTVGNNVKWSVYVKKNVYRNFYMVGQMARDHQRWVVPVAQWDKQSDWEELSLRPNHWVWNLKAEIKF